MIKLNRINSNENEYLAKWNNIIVIVNSCLCGQVRCRKNNNTQEDVHSSLFGYKYA